jgi:hypothetical protein
MLNIDLTELYIDTARRPQWLIEFEGVLQGVCDRYPSETELALTRINRKMKAKKWHDYQVPR